ncbi:MAG: tRNA-dihydrouridine synthase [Geodermatophilaceae bacterium]
MDSPVVLAPMAGITNPASRQICREYGGGLYVCEMITSRALVERNERTMRMDPVRAGGVAAVAAALRRRPGHRRCRSACWWPRTGPTTST